MNANNTHFFLFPLFVFPIFLICFYVLGKKAFSIFPPINTVKVIYRNKYASGYSMKAIWTRMGGSSKVLDVVVTDKELWLKSMVIFADIAAIYDMVHKIALDKITRVENSGSKIIVSFTGSARENKQVVIIVNNPEAFLSAVRRNASSIIFH